MKDTTFFEEILATPEDYSLRLIYADWLEEQGDSRGELLRIVHEMSQTPVCSARYRKLRFRRDRLCKRCDGDWLKPMLRASFPEIRKKLEELDRLDPARAVFTSDSHQYRLNPPLAVERVEQIELQIGCRLPEQYRRFVTEFADGGAGPNYGIRPLESLLGATDDTEWLASLATPFPAPTNVEEMRSLDYSPPGVLPVCEIGCGGYYHLILSGPERGNVWVQNPDGDWTPTLYEWGDRLDIVFVGPEDDANASELLGPVFGTSSTPFAGEAGVVVGPQCEEAVRTLLLGENSKEPIEKVGYVFRHVEGAWEFVESQIK